MFGKHHPPGPHWFSFATEPPKHALDFCHRLFVGYGDIVKFGFLKSAYLLNHPDYVKHVLHTRHDNYRKGGAPMKALEEALGFGLLTNQGEVWRSRRNIVQPMLSPAQMEAYFPRMREQFAKVCQRWDAFAKQGKTVDISEEIMRGVLIITSDILFDEDLTASSGRLLALIYRCHRYVCNSPLRLRYWPGLRNVRYRLAKKTLDNMLTKIIDKHRAAQDEQNIFSKLFEATDPNTGKPLNPQALLDEFKTLLATGHETTASGLNWALYCIAKHPEVQQRLQQEVHSVFQGQPPQYQDLKQLTYTRMALEETWRLYPPIWLTGRTAIAADEIAGFPIPSQATVLVCPYNVHRHPAYWQYPNDFYPEHFAPQAKAARPKHAYLPFGTGPRVCIASHLATTQSMMILAMIMQRFTLKLKNTKPVLLEPLISLKPKGKIKMQFGTPSFHDLTTESKPRHSTT